MKKLIMLAMALGLFTVGTARAEGAWVLWETRQLWSATLGLQQPVWHMIDNFPTAEQCKEYRKTMCEKALMSGFTFDRSNCPSYLEGSDGKFITLSNFECLPDTIDPRK